MIVYIENPIDSTKNSSTFAKFLAFDKQANRTSDSKKEQSNYLLSKVKMRKIIS